jgi:2-dehydropantoate 2-reductase
MSLSFANMKILVYGAGNIGSLYATLLRDSGQDVSILARGERLSRIREHGIETENVRTGKKTTTRISAVESLEPADTYDLVLVTLARHHISEVLPVLAENEHTPSILFMVNNATGPGEMIEALGPERVLLGFPGAAGFFEGGVLRYVITSQREQPTTIGELDGRRSSRIEAIADALEQAGFSVAICPNMDAWLKTHVAELSPTANAFYMAGGDLERLARTRDALLLMLRAIREGYRVLNEQAVPITPTSHKIFKWVPEPILLSLMRQMVRNEETAIKVGHALDAREEWQRLADDFRALADGTSVSTPAMDRLYLYLDPEVEPMADGSVEIPLNWSGVWIAVSVLAGLLILLGMLLR